MASVTVKNKYQVVIPQQVRDEIEVSVGDVFEAKVENGRIIFERRSTVDQGIAESLAEIRAGSGFGPFATHGEFLASLHKEVKKLDRKKRKR